MNEEKSFDGTVARLLELLQSEFNIDTPVYVMFMSPKTQCFHYSGKKYYRELIRRLIKEGKRKLNQLENRLNTIKYIINQSGLSKLYNFQNSTSSTDPIDQFLEILVNTPCSRHYGMIGRVYHTGVPVFCYTREQYLNSGILKFIEDDSILGVDKQDDFKKIIVESEKFIWGERKTKREPFADIKSTMMVPIHLYNQFVGAVFVTNEKAYSNYDYIRFIQIIKEFSITAIKDAKEYEFLSSVLTDMPSSGFNVNKSIFINLPVILSVTGVCLKSNNEYHCLLFEKTGTELLPTWQAKRMSQCENCNTFENKNHLDTISLGEICQIHINNRYIKPKSGLLIQKGDIKIILYFDFVIDLLELQNNSIDLLIQNAFELIKITEKNVQFHNGYGHDTESLISDIDYDAFEPIKITEKNVQLRKDYKHDTKRLIDDIDYDDFVKGIIGRRTKLMVKLFGETIHRRDLTDVNIKEEVNKIWKIYNYRYRMRKNKYFIVEPKIENCSEINNIYWPAIECVLYNLIKNTFRNIENSSIETTEIFYIDNTLTYVQKGNNFIFGVPPETLHQYLKGENINWTNKKGLGHYIIQWIVDRFNGNLLIEFNAPNSDTIIIEKKRLYIDLNKSLNETSVIYKIKFPENWREV